MKATEAPLLKFIKDSEQFIIPIYQRSYSWTEAQCLQLWKDVLRAGSSDKIDSHFVGSVVYIEDGLYQISGFKPVLVIDGQQRLTTTILLLAALAEKLGDEEIEGFTATKIRNYYLLNPEETNEQQYKLLLTKTDKDSLISIIGNHPKPKEFSHRIHENYERFQLLLNESEKQLDAICRGIRKLQVVDVSLDRNHDNPQLIFESMNSTGLALSQADLIRNYVLMGLKPKEQTRLYNDYWREMEIKFGQEAYRAEFDKFMRHYLTVKTGDIPNINKVYEAFKAFSLSLSGDVENLVSDLKNFADYYCNVALGKEDNKDLKEAFHDLRELKVEVAYPFLLEIYSDYAEKVLAKEELLQAVRMVESYVFRRTVCSIPTNSMNKTFATFGKSLKKDRYLESIQAHFLNLPSYRRFPHNEEFKRDIQLRDLYNFRNRSFWLRRMENFNRKERVPVDQYTIEHILPQNPDLPAQWQTDLGEKWKEIQEKYLHTLGNLTLTGYNSEYQDKPFSEKRDMDGGFAQSPLKLNAGLGQIAVWNEAEITKRADRLAAEALQVWTVPELPKDILAVYKSKDTKGDFSLSDHPQLKGDTKKLFEAFQKEILALDDCVEMEIRKLYIAFKAETNFVDVVPQKNSLKLTLNIDFAQIQDPQSLCRDVTDIGHWGNGNVEFILESESAVSYAVGLARQALETQLGDGDVE